MQETEKIISLYHTGFIVCLVLFILFLLVTVLLFFRFDIRNVIDLRTGRGAKKTIQKMEEINAKTGKLRQEMTAQTPSVLRPEERVILPPTEETVCIKKETEVMNTDVLGPPGGQKIRQQELPGAFKIIKDNMWVHTDEFI